MKYTIISLFILLISCKNAVSKSNNFVSNKTSNKVKTPQFKEIKSDTLTVNNLKFTIKQFKEENLSFSLVILNENFDTKISAIIDETYQNGNYFIKGNKEVIIDGQKQEIVITGVIRPYDITSDNSINSSQIANLKMLYKKDGAEADLLQVPWGTKILRAIWPF